MPKSRPLILLALATIASQTQAASFVPYLKKHSHQLAHQFNPQYGIIIANENGHINYAKNKDHYFASASILKLFTASAAIVKLGPSFRYKTTLSSNASPQSHTLNGNLYLTFSGDPSLTSTDLRTLFATLKQQGIDTINGSLYFDDSAFDHVQYAPGITVDDLAYSYASPVNAITVDENAFDITLSPSTVNQPPRIETTDLNPSITLINHIKTTPRRVKHCPLTINSDNQNHYWLSGCISLAGGPKKQSLAVRNTLEAMQYALPAILNDTGITLNGHMQTGITPHSTHTLCTHVSAPLNRLVIKMLKQSDNLISNALVKTVSHHQSHQAGNFAEGLRIIQTTLTKLSSINFDKTHISDGAGLSRYNLITPNQVLRLLVAIKRTPTLKRYILPALPIAGKDGTLEDRMKILGKRQRLRAKTGTLSGVSNIAGYLNSKHHGRKIVIMLINQFPNKVNTMRKWTDTVLTHLALY